MSPNTLRSPSESAILSAEAQSLHSLAAMFRSMPGEFSRAVGAGLAVQAADFQAEAQRLKSMEQSA